MRQETMGDTNALLRDIRSELLRLQRQLSRLTLLTRAQVCPMMSLEEAALYTGYAKSYLYKLTGDGELPCYRPTRRKVFVERKALDDWIRRNDKKTPTICEDIHHRGHGCS